MAAVPSVVIGFLILLWLAAFGRLAPGGSRRHADAARRVPDFYAPLAANAKIPSHQTPGTWLRVPLALAGHHSRHRIGPLVVAPFLEAWLFHGSFKQWLFNFTARPYDPLNALVVAFGLGFAVIPIIFSIAEDALSNIPHNLTAASMVIGTSRWQTLWRIILPSASPESSPP